MDCMPTWTVLIRKSRRSIWISFSPDLRFWGTIAAHHEAGCCINRTKRRSVRVRRRLRQSTDGCRSIMAFSRPLDGSIYRLGGRASRLAESGQDHRRGGLVDPLAGRSLGGHRLCAQRGIHLWRRGGIRWNGEDLLGRAQTR